uniref:Low density lipoprotein receptor adapter protein 1 n=1 Tax=Sphaerodactylus townsendi TaxID=933632 RepID=A0ACB8FRA8_9SAUR
MLFNLKYLGMTLVEQPKGEDLSAAAVKRIVATAKASGKKLQKITLKVSPRGIILSDSITNEPIENISIYRISYCTADKVHDKVFAYIAQSQLNENLECHAFLCTKRKMIAVLGQGAGGGHPLKKPAKRKASLDHADSSLGPGFMPVDSILVLRAFRSHP